MVVLFILLALQIFLSIFWGNLLLLICKFDVMCWITYLVTWCLVWIGCRPTIQRLIGLAPCWIHVLMVFLLPWSAPILASIHAHIFSYSPCPSYYRQCFIIKLQLGLLCCMMTPIVSLADLAVFSVQRGLQPLIPLLNLLHIGIYYAMNMHTCLKHPVEYLNARSNTDRPYRWPCLTTKTEIISYE